MISVVVKVNPSIEKYISDFLANSSLSRSLLGEVAKGFSVPVTHIRVEWIKIDDALNTPDLGIEVRFAVTEDLYLEYGEKIAVAESLVTLVREFEGLPKDIHWITSWVVPENESVYSSIRV